MTLRLSTALRNALLDQRVVIDGVENVAAATISFDEDGGDGGGYGILDSGSGFGDFDIGDIIVVSGSTINDGVYSVTHVAAGVLTVLEAVSDEAAGDDVSVAVAHGGSFKDLFEYGCMRIYSGSQPSSADDAESGTLLVEITKSSGTLTAGHAANGLQFAAAASSGTLSKLSGQVWSGVAGNTATAGYFRFYTNSKDTGAGTDKTRFDGAVAISGGQLNMSSTSITASATVTIDSFAITMPAS